MRLSSVPLVAGVTGAAMLAALGLSACGTGAGDRETLSPRSAQTYAAFQTDPDVPVVEDLRYGTASGQPLLLDACLPPDVTAPTDPEPSATATVDGEDPDATPVSAAPEAPSSGVPTSTPAPGAGSGTVVTPDAETGDQGDDSAETPDTDAATSSDRGRPAIVMVHGGSWTRGDKADIPWRSTCQWLAKAGYPTFNVDYRLAPAHPFPAGIDDVTKAVEWLRQTAQVERFDLDPGRIGAFGGSAGGNLVALLGTQGEGPTTGAEAVEGPRVAAVVDLSGPVDLTGRAVMPDFVPVQLSYLGCASESACPAAEKASAGTFVDESDPPFFVAHSSNEKIPLAQSTRFVAQLRDAGVDVTFVEVTGRNHSIAMLDDALRDRILAFYREKLVGAKTGVVP